MQLGSQLTFGALWITDGNGSVQAAGVPAGDYLLCVQKPNSSLLDPCSWSSPIHVNTLQAAENRKLGSVTVAFGTLVQIAVSDSSALLPQWNDISSDGGLIVGIFHGDHIWSPSIRNSNKTFSVAVPTATTYQLWVFSRQFNFSVPGIGATASGVVTGPNSMASNGLLSSSITAGTEPVGGYQLIITGAKN